MGVGPKPVTCGTGADICVLWAVPDPCSSTMSLVESQVSGAVGHRSWANSRLQRTCCAGCGTRSFEWFLLGSLVVWQGLRDCESPVFCPTPRLRSTSDLAIPTRVEPSPRKPRSASATRPSFSSISDREKTAVARRSRPSHPKENRRWPEGRDRSACVALPSPRRIKTPGEDSIFSSPEVGTRPEAL